MPLLTSPIMAIVRHAENETDRGTPRLRLVLEHDGDPVDALLQPCTRPATHFPPGLEVVVRLQMENGAAGDPALRITAIEPARLSLWTPGSLPGGVDHLPDWLVEAAVHPERVRALWAWLSMLTCRPLQTFALRVFHDPAISIPFVRNQASREHHHAHAGGLLQHSLEVATHLPWLEDGMDRIEWEVAGVAALFHDIGKVWVDYGSSACTDEVRLTRHEDATLELLAPHLAWLRDRDPKVVAMLRHHLGLAGRDIRPLMPGAMLPVALDRLSAACGARERAFRDRPDWQRFGHLDARGPGNRFYRPRQSDSHEPRATLRDIIP